MAKPTPKLTFEQVEALYDSVLSNSYYLGQDAALLLEHGSLERSMSLAVLALEEAGKAVLIHNAKVSSFQRALRDPDLDSKFWVLWRGHSAKLKAIREFTLLEDYWFDAAPPPINELLLGPIEDYLAELDQYSAEVNDSKFRGFYVDVDPATGDPVMPVIPDQEGVRDLLGVVHQVGWQLRLGDHIQFVATPRDLGTLDPEDPYTAHADGGTIAAQRESDFGWEAHGAELVRVFMGLNND